MSDRYPIRIGMVNFINTAPIYEVWKRTVHRPDWQIIAEAPRVLNRMLFDGQLEMGCVSSHEYAAHPDRYEVLADLSISASGPVGSVFLFARVKPEQLNGRVVLLSNQSQTSVSLVKILLEEFYGIKPHYLTGSVFEPADRERDIDAVLAIGDEALRLEGSREYPIRLDLGETWHHHTGLPFVFALWTVRQDFCKTAPLVVAEIHHELLRCLAEGRRDLETICAAVAPRIPMSPAACLSYLQSMEYDLGPRKQEALACFFKYLAKRGEGAANALPLKIFQKQV